MFTKWLKPYLPRSLFGRAIAILIVPVVLIQVVVGVVLVERLFQNVSRQMAHAVSLDVNFLISQLETEPFAQVQETAAALEISLSQPAEFGPDMRDFLDVSGITVTKVLREKVQGAVQIDLVGDDDFARILVAHEAGLWQFSVPWRRLAATNPHQLLVIMMLAAILITALSIGFLRNQVQPIRRLAAAAEAFGKGWSVPLKPRGASEVRAAGHAFLSMRARIERQIEQRTLMLSGVSHDLRTPLTRLKLSLSLMDPDEETALMERDINEMAGILDEFLAFSSGGSGEIAEPVNPKALAKRLIRDHRRSGAEVALEFAGNTADDRPVMMRKVATQRALGNLLGNALKYGDKSRLTLYLGTGFIEFVVEDNGPGIRKDQREDAQKAFSQLDRARNQDKGTGVGLGLAIARDVARGHGGGMTLGHSSDLGGLKVSFRMPR